MENPATWNKAEQVIAEAIDEHNKALESGLLCGPSIVRRIHTKLHVAGLLKEEE